MDYREAREELKPRLRDYVESITSKSKGRGMYICPLCGSGTGSHNTGAFSIDPKKPTQWRCFSCNKSGDIFDLIGEVEHISDPIEQLKRAADLYRIDLSLQDQGATKLAQKKPKKEQHTDMHTDTYTYTDTHKDLLPYIKECAGRIKETGYPAERGISEETAARFWLGYDPHYKVNGGEWKALIIPTGRESIVARNTDPNAAESDRYRKRGNSTPFNTKALQDAQKPIFITEGELDALSIIEVGGEAIGLGSIANIDKFIRDYVKPQKPAQPLVIALDNDEAGQQASIKLSEKLKEAGVPFYMLDPCNGSKDANTALLKDREAFKREVERADHIDEEEQEAALEAAREDLYKDSAAYHLAEFVDNIAESASTPAQSTGFKKLDETLDGGLYEGLYILGAISSLGKTTLALQIADQIAKSGRDVLIISLEMARSELMSKSISRHTLLDVLENGGDMRNPKTNRGITAAGRYESYSEAERELITRAITAYAEYAEHIYIHEGLGNIGVEYIREKVNKHQIITGRAPVVIVDYIQILAPYNDRATDKQNTDKAVLELKRISRDFKTPVIGISSFNRASYRDEVAMEAFKESGAIEYSSDVLIGLQLKGAGKSDFDTNEAKKRNPREIELVILKNRNGRTGDKLPFKYYPLFNYFEEMK